MSGYTLRSPNTVLTTLIESGQIGTIGSDDMRDMFTSGMSALPNTQTTSYTLVLTDAWLCVEMAGGSE